jgi:hypothetical protein
VQQVTTTKAKAATTEAPDKTSSPPQQPKLSEAPQIIVHIHRKTKWAYRPFTGG